MKTAGEFPDEVKNDSYRPRIAVDAMGGDHAPGAVVAGALAAAGKAPLRVILVGPREKILAELERQGAADAGLEIVEAPEVIGPDESPVAALRRKRNSSMAVGLRLVKHGEADAFVSAGSTGALMAGGLLTLGRIPGVDRPALASILNTVNGGGVLLLDLGANVEASAENLFQFAVMGSIYMERVIGVEKPRVGLLNVGTETNKGSESVKSAYHLLSTSSLNFIGNVEGRSLLQGIADVVVTDGFSGNLVLKSMEGLAATMLELLKEEVGKGWRERVGALLLKPALKRLRKRLDYAEFGGAALLGVGGVVVKCHGSSDARAVENGIRVAARALEQRIVEQVREALVRGGETVV